MNNVLKTLEMWKTLRFISLLSCIFDTSFLAFIWIMGWTAFFWVYLVMSIISLFSLAYEVNKLWKVLK